MWSVGAIVAVAVLGLLTLVGAASCLYMKRRSTNGSVRNSRRLGELDERLLAEQQAERGEQTRTRSNSGPTTSG